MEILKTIIAYFIAINLSLLIGGLASLIVLPILSFSFFRKKFPKILLTIFIGISIGFCSVLSATVIFSWFSITAGNLMLIILSVGFLHNNIYRIRNRPHTGWEYRRMFGDFLGITIAASVFVWGFSFNQITIPLIISATIITAYAYLSTKSNIEFWELLAKNPEVGYLHLKGSDAWFIIEEDSNNEQMSTDFKWEGPFNHYIPSIGKRIKIYGKVGEYEKSQDEFISNFG